MNYVSPNKPDPHQTEYLRRLTLRPKKPSDEDVMAILAEMGTGKSYMLLDEWQRAVGRGDLQDLLIMAPAGSYKNWYQDKSDLQKSEMRAHLDPELLKDIWIAPWVSGGGTEVRNQIAKVLGCTDKKRPRAMFVNVEAMSKVEKAKSAAASFLRRGTAMFGVDESTSIKGDTKRTANILALAPMAPARRILTGLVTPRSPMDLYFQFAFLDPRILGYDTIYGFRYRYAITRQMEVGGRRFKVIVGYKNLQELQAKIAPYSYRVLKKDVLSIEKKNFLPIRDVELTKEQQRMYDEIREYATSSLDVDTHVTATSVMTQIIRLHQVVLGYIVDEEGVAHDIPSNRVKAVIEVLEEHDGKAIVWCSDRRTLAKLVDAVEKHFREEKDADLSGYVVTAQYHGGNKGTRHLDEQRFLGDPRCRYMFSTQGAGGKGNTWNVADLTVYACNNYDLEQRNQSEDRNHRRGQTKPVTYVDIAAAGTVEIKIILSLRMKIDMATAITGENYREWLI